MTTTEPARLQLEPDESPVVLPAFKSILIAADASDHSNRGVADAVELGKLWQSTITGTHVYAAKMHDFRFRQMEGGLPEQYQEETELEKAASCPPSRRRIEPARDPPKSTPAA